jgi:glutathione-regulated potassium-efflux system protein KefB
MPEQHGVDLIRLVALLGAAVIAVPIFKRIGLGAVLGYLAAGLIIGPSVIGVFEDAESVLAVAELGIVMLLFVIGLELQPSRLWGLRKDIFGLGLAQVLLCGALLAGAGIALGVEAQIAAVAAMGLALSSTAFVLQILEERGDSGEAYGRRTFAILLLQDMAIVPLLAAVAFLAPTGETEGRVALWVQAVTATGAIVVVVFGARYVLNPLFRLFAATRAREIMTAAALLAVLGAAAAMQAGGLSMGLGAFLAGVALSESSFRHQLEADIEPFRGLLLGLFFMAVGMSIDLALVGQEWAAILGIVMGFMVLKGAGIYAVARIFKSGHRDAVRMALLLAQGGEFAFVLYSAAAESGVIDAQSSGVLTAAVIISMALTPLAVLLLKRLVPVEPPSLDGVTVADGLSGAALVIGFGRFGQIASQFLLARGVDVTIIDSDPDMIRNASRFGFKIYYGDGTRRDVLLAAGGDKAEIICICIDNKAAASTIVDVAKEVAPFAKLYVRSYDRGHAIQIISKGVEFEMRETVLSAMALGEAALKGLGYTAEEAAETAAEVKRRDLERLQLQVLEGSVTAGGDLVFRQGPVPTPLTPPRREAEALTEETREVTGDQKEEPAAQVERGA